LGGVVSTFQHCLEILPSGYQIIYENDQAILRAPNHRVVKNFEEGASGERILQIAREHQDLVNASIGRCEDALEARRERLGHNRGGSRGRGLG
jgi:hypothetical protein